MSKLSIAGSARISEVARLLADKGYTFEPRKRSHVSDQQRMDEIQNALEKLKKLKNVKTTANIILRNIRHNKALNHLVGAKSQPTPRQRMGPVRIGGTSKT